MQYPICGVSAAKAKKVQQLGHVFRMPNDRMPEKLLFGTVKGLAHLAALGLVSMMLRCVIVELVDPIDMRKTDSFGETRFVLHVPSSS